MSESELTSRIMRRVYLVYWMRRAFAHPLAVKGAVFAALVVASRALVSMENVIENMPDDYGALFQFSVNAFVHTELVVQAVVLGIAAVFFFIMKDIALGVRKKRHHFVLAK